MSERVEYSRDGTQKFRVELKEVITKSPPGADVLTVLSEVIAAIISAGAETGGTERASKVMLHSFRIIAEGLGTPIRVVINREEKTGGLH